MRQRRVTRPRLLDLFCGGGGAAVGYHRAGFDVVGVDNRPMPSYPFEFHQADAMEYPLDGFDVIHASPPCHAYSNGCAQRRNLGHKFVDLLGPTQERLRASGLVYVIENVTGARRLLRDPILLCGSMFGLGVVRHRYFESSVWLWPPPHVCNKRQLDGDAMSVTQHGPPNRWYKRNPGKVFSITTWHDGMGIDWMPRGPLTQAIPPAYTQFIGEQLLVQGASRGQ